MLVVLRKDQQLIGCVDDDGVKIVNIYKPPSSQMTITAIPVFSHPCLYAGDFNCQHTDWGYTFTSQNGEQLADWAAKSNLHCYTILRMLLVSSLVDGALELIQIWLLRVLVSAGPWTGVYWKSFLGPNTDLR